MFKLRGYPRALQGFLVQRKLSELRTFNSANWRMNLKSMSHSKADMVSGSGRYPSCDAWGKPFTKADGHRFALAGTSFPGGFLGIFDGLQADQDFLRLVFGLQNFASRQRCCYFCSTIQWVRADQEASGDNSPEFLYTRWGIDASHRQTRLGNMVDFC